MLEDVQVKRQRLGKLTPLRAKILYYFTQDELPWKAVADKIDRPERTMYKVDVDAIYDALGLMQYRQELRPGILFAEYRELIREVFNDPDSDREQLVEASPEHGILPEPATMEGATPAASRGQLAAEGAPIRQSAAQPPSESRSADESESALGSDGQSCPGEASSVAASAAAADGAATRCGGVTARLPSEQGERSSTAVASRSWFQPRLFRRLRLLAAALASAALIAAVASFWHPNLSRLVPQAQPSGPAAAAYTPPSGPSSASPPTASATPGLTGTPSSTAAREPATAQSSLESVSLPFSDNFDNGLRPEWWTIGGNWQVANGALTDLAQDGEGRICVGNPAWHNYVLTGEIVWDQDSSIAAGIIVRAGANQGMSYVVYPSYSRWVLDTADQSVERADYPPEGRLPSGRIPFRIEVRDNEYRAVVGNQYEKHIEDGTLQNGYIALWLRGNVKFDNLQVTPLP